MKRSLTFVLLLSALAVPAAPARAATVEVSAGTLRFTAAAGEPNHAIFHFRSEDELVVYNTSYERPLVTAGHGCTQDGESTVICPRAGVTRAEFALGDRARDPAFVPDRLTLTADVPVPVTVSAAIGSRAGVSYIDLRPVLASLDGQANDGPAARGDNLGPGVDNVFGGDGTDTITGNERANSLDGDNGADSVAGEAGDDRITAASYNDVGADAIGLETRGADTIACGAGRDVVFADDSDRVAADCEMRVRVHDSGYTYTGTARADRIIVDRGPAVVRGRGGDDRLGGQRFTGGLVLYGDAGDDRIAGHSESDTLTGGSGRDRVIGAAGDDRIAVRDGFTDTVSCGAGRDSVTADRRDRVARDCERVARR